MQDRQSATGIAVSHKAKLAASVFAET